MTTSSKRKFTKPLGVQLKELLLPIFYPKYKRRGKNEYAHRFLSTVFLFITSYYSLAVLFGYFLALSPKMNASYSAILWSPELFLLIPIYVLLLAKSMVELISAYFIVAVLPFFVSAFILGFLMGGEIKDVIPLSIIIIFAIYSILFLFESIFLSILNLPADITLNLFFVYVAVDFLLVPLVIGLVSSYLGALLGIAFGKFAKAKRGSFVAIDDTLLPEIPITASTIFDLKVSEDEKRAFENKTLSLVLLNKRVERILKTTRLKICPYFKDNRCSYLGYKTAGHRLQICVTELWPLCRIYVFIVQSKKVIREIKYRKIEENVMAKD